MRRFDPKSYGPVFAPRLKIDRRRPLDRGKPDQAARSSLEQLDLKATFAGATKAVADPEMAACCLSGAWLLNDYLDESHLISQHIETPTGCYWHAIMHRREGDFSNAKHWYRKVGDHPVLEPLGKLAVDIAKKHGASDLADTLAADGVFDPFAFVDLCQASVGKTDKKHELCLDLQQAEWELLFDHCYRAAVGS